MQVIYLFHGEDHFRRQQALKVLVNSLVDPDWASTNYVQMQNPSIAELADSAGTCPFGFGERVLVINDAKFLINKTDDVGIARLTSALSELPDRVSIVFNSNKVLGTLKLVKALKKISEVEEFKTLQAWEIKPAAAWLAKIAKGLGAKTSQGTLEFLVDYIGTDTAKLHGELVRLSTLTENITEDLIQRECKAKHDIFKFAEEIAKANSQGAQSELRKIIQSGEINIGFLIGLQTNLSKYLKLKLMIHDRVPPEEQLKKLSVTSGRMYYLKQAVGAMDLQHLKFLNDKLAQIESQVKQGKTQIDFALRLLTAS